MFTLTKTLSSFIAAGAMATALLTATVQPAAAQDRAEPAAAQTLVAEAFDAGLETLRQYRTDSPARQEAFVNLAEDYFDLYTISRLALGRHNRAATDDQLARFEPVFTEFLAQKYSALLGTTTDAEYSFIDVTESGRRDVLVHMDLRAEGERYHVAWRVRLKDGDPRIIDVQLADISLLIAVRDELGSLVRREGGIDPMIARLEAFTVRSGRQTALVISN